MAGERPEGRPPPGPPAPPEGGGGGDRPGLSAGRGPHAHPEPVPPGGGPGPSAHGGGHPRGRLDVRGPGAEPKLLHGPGRPGVRRDGDELPPAAPGGPPGAGAGRVCQPPLAGGARGGARLRPVPDSAHGRFRRRASGRPHRLHSKEPRPPSPLWGSALEA